MARSGRNETVACAHLVVVLSVTDGGRGEGEIVLVGIKCLRNLGLLGAGEGEGAERDPHGEGEPGNGESGKGGDEAACRPLPAGVEAQRECEAEADDRRAERGGEHGRFRHADAVEAPGACEHLEEGRDAADERGGEPDRDGEGEFGDEGRSPVGGEEGDEGAIGREKDAVLDGADRDDRAGRIDDPERGQFQDRGGEDQDKEDEEGLRDHRGADRERGRVASRRSLLDGESAVVTPITTSVSAIQNAITMKPGSTFSLPQPL